MAATSKRLLISESRGDSNRCTPCRGNPDQHASYAFYASPRTPDIRFLRAVPVHGNLSHWANRVGQIHCSREKVHRLHLLARLSGPRDPPQFLSQHSNWSSALKPNICQQQVTRFTGPISPACDRYVQYLLMGTNPSVLNWHRWGLPHRKPRNSHNTLPALPFWGFHWSP
jgi:hypothetical protein